jgi:hypothetical protein
MTRTAQIAEPQMSEQIDRLVAGDLDEAARRRVLAWLEDDPLRWRLCGLAFLEAQTWSQAMDEWHSPACPRTAAARALPERQSARRRRMCAYSAAVVACLLVAFAFGFAASVLLQSAGAPTQRDVADFPPSRNERRSPPEQITAADRPAAEPVLAAVSVKPFGAGAPAAVHIPVRPGAADDPSGNGSPPEIPEYVRRRWERRGFKIESERRYVLARLPDGEQVAVPIEQIHISPMETRIY